MELLAVLRNHGFWMLDRLRGGTIKKNYNVIKQIDMMNSDNPFVRKHQSLAWEELKKYAVQNTKFYRDYDTCVFDEFPIITKNDIRERQDDFLSMDFEKEKLIQMSTSGSTGTPFVCYQNSGKKKRVNAEIIYYSEKVGYRLGKNLSYIRTIVKQNRKSGLKQFLQNQTLINCGKINNSGVEKLLQSIRQTAQKESVTLLAYGSTYTAIKDYFIKNGLEKWGGIGNVVGAISGSDMLFDDTREYISRIFGNIPVVSRYSNEENGVLGQDEEINNVFTINEADYIVEIVNDKDEVLPKGELGRIVVTDLYNYAMPMIRYDTGDMGAVDEFEINGRRKLCICDFSGRKVDVIFDAKGNALSPHTITNAMWDFPDIRQFQLIQTGAEVYTLKLNVEKEFGREKELVTVLQKVLGEEASIRIDRIAEIPVLASGKRRYIVNEWKK